MDSVPRKHCTLELGGNGAAVVLGDCASDAGPGLGRDPYRHLLQLPGRPVLHLRAARDRGRLRVRPAAAAASSPPSRPRSPATRPTTRPTSARWSARTPPSASSPGSTRPSPAGAKLLAGGKRDGASYAPTVLTDVPADATIACEEVFGPVLTVRKVDGEAEAFAAVNDSKYGLQAGVFTHDLQTAFRAHRALEVGGVIIGDVPSYRADQMPYGGAKQSGVGREGVRFAMDDYTYERVLVLTGLACTERCNPRVDGPTAGAHCAGAPAVAVPPRVPDCGTRTGGEGGNRVRTDE